MITTPVAVLEARAEALRARLGALPGLAPCPCRPPKPPSAGAARPASPFRAGRSRSSPPTGPRRGSPRRFARAGRRWWGASRTGRVLLDLRTVDPSQDHALGDAVARAAADTARTPGPLTTPASPHPPPGPGRNRRPDASPSARHTSPQELTEDQLTIGTGDSDVFVGRWTGPLPAGGARARLGAPGGLDAVRRRHVQVRFGDRAAASCHGCGATQRGRRARRPSRCRRASCGATPSLHGASWRQKSPRHRAWAAQGRSCPSHSRGMGYG